LKIGDFLISAVENWQKSATHSDQPASQPAKGTKFN
jgi:hypothetical protein